MSVVTIFTIFSCNSESLGFFLVPQRFYIQIPTGVQCLDPRLKHGRHYYVFIFFFYSAQDRVRRVDPHSSVRSKCFSVILRR